MRQPWFIAAFPNQADPVTVKGGRVRVLHDEGIHGGLRQRHGFVLIQPVAQVSEREKSA